MADIREHTLFDTVHITMPIASLLNGERSSDSGEAEKRGSGM